ncbi:MAG TPA: ATP-binding protein [Caulobacteraceae bacterium]
MTDVGATDLAGDAAWLAANGRFMSAGVAWVRDLLRRRADLGAAPAPAPAAAHRSWSGIAMDWGRRVEPPTPPLLTSSSTAVDPAASHAAMQAVATAMARPPALTVLAERLTLSAFEQQVLLLCVAAELDTSIGPLCASAQHDLARPFPTFALGLSIFDDPAWDVVSPDRPLRHWRLVELGQAGYAPLIASQLRADEQIVNFLKGAPSYDDRLAALATPIPSVETLPASQQATADLALRQWRDLTPGRAAPAIQLLGTDPASKRAVAAAIAAGMGRCVQRMDAAMLPTAPGELEQLARLWQRESLLLPVALYLDTEQAEPAHVPAVDRLLGRLSGPVLLATRQLWPTSAEAPIAVDVAKPTVAEQTAAWTAGLGAAASDLPERMSSQFNLADTAIRELARRETSANDSTGTPLAQRIWDAARSISRPRLDTLARRITPRVTWDDIVLPAAEISLLHAVADQIGRRNQVYQDWGFADRMSRGLGITALFAGPSGSGKTLAAEVMAGHLRLDLFRIDLSTVVSKYIGETETNLRKVFDAAEEGGAILFFDEADALFGKRTEVKDSHDRYANIEIDYLLQRMESFAGMAILATNMKSAMDQAFLRRLRFVVDFPFPGVAERAAIWKRAFPAATPTQGLDFDRLARLNVTGGHIAVIAVNAAFQAANAAGPVTMSMVLNAARIEFRKLGRPVNEADFRWQEAAA